MKYLNGTYYPRREELKRLKIDFVMRKTTNTTYLEYLGRKEMFSNTYFERKYLHLFQKIKKEVKKNIEGKNLMDYEQQSLYFQFQSIPLNLGEGEIHTIENVWEADINKAYYQAAFNLGYISREFYETCIGLPKKIRLALVGSIATRKSIFTYEKGKLSKIEYDLDKELRKAWFNIVREVDQALLFFAQRLGGAFIFYWVDGIYFERHDYMKEIIQETKDLFNFDFSIEKLSKIDIANVSNTENQIDVYKKKKIKRFFTKNLFKNY